MANQTLNNLKSIHQLQSEGTLSSFLGDIRSSKTEINSFSKKLQDKKKELSLKKESTKVEKVEKNTEIVTKVEEIVDFKTEIENMEIKPVKNRNNNTNNNKQSTNNSNFKRFDNNHNNNQTDYQNRNNNYQGQRNFQNNNGGNNRQNNFQRQNNGQNQQGQNRFQNNRPNSQGQKPYQNNNGNFQRQNNGQNQGQRKTGSNNFVSTKTNKFRSFAPTESSAVLAQPERNFGNKNKTKRNYSDENKKQIRKVNEGRRNNIIIENEDGFEETTMGSRKLLRNKKKETPIIVAPKIQHAIITSREVSVKDLSEKIGKPVAEIVKKLMLLGVMATINSSIDFDTAELISSELGVTLELKLDKTYEEKLMDASNFESDENMVKRPPVVAVMGHVDHGKTSLLDAFRKTNVVLGEAGGITQKIGAYQISFNGEKITFIDTPGHAAFTSMRARGAQVTDIAILVVAADDGIMPQTVEAINHIKAAKVPMIIAINKIDKPEANIDRVKQQLTEYDVLPEEWGGDAICVPISAKKGIGLDELKQTILLVAEMEELKANPDKMATGVVIEAELDKTRGAVATVLVQNGTLNIGDSIMSGITYGKVKAMFDENGRPVKKATPSTPVSVMGFNDVPNSGDHVYVVDETLSKQVINERINKIKEERAKQTSGVSLDDFMNKINEGKLKNLNVIIKADTQGSVEALRNSLVTIENEEVKVNCLHSGAGAVTESDVLLAQTTGAIIIAFNIKSVPKVKQLAEALKIEIKDYKIIYEVINDITDAMNGMMTVKYEEVYCGTVEIRMVFKLSTAGKVAGCYVTNGKVLRNAIAKVKRGNEDIGESTVESLKIVKDEKSEVNKGFECGIKLKDNIEYKEGDIIEFYTKEVIKRK